VKIATEFTNYFADGLKALANFFSFLGGHQWAVAIIALTLIVRTLLLPLAIKQIRSMREMQRLQPELNRLKQKYRNDRNALNQETMALYQREGINPLASCLPMFAQFPILFAMYAALRRFTPIALDDLRKLSDYVAKHDVSAAKAVQTLKIRMDAHKLQTIVSYAQKHHETLYNAALHTHVVVKMPFLGLGDLSNHAISTPAGWILIVLMSALSFLSTLQFNMGQTDQQKRMQLLMPLFFVVLFLRYPVALLLYWTTQQAYQFVQQTIMTRDTRRAKGGFWKSFSSGATAITKKTVKEPKARPQPRLRPAAAVASGGSAAIEAMQSRRDLEEKRRRRRNNKKKKKRRR
jgi:YidC/Oxa1 family membrane protein insertase